MALHESTSDGYDDKGVRIGNAGVLEEKQRGEGRVRESDLRMVAREAAALALDETVDYAGQRSTGPRADVREAILID